jgi:hypothetical protein
MIQKIKKHLILISAGLAIIIPGLVPALVTSGVYAANPSINSNAGTNIAGGLCSGIGDATGGSSVTGSSSGGCTTSSSSASGTLQSIAKDVINIFSIIVGIVAVIMIIVGGFRYVTSGGASDKVGGAKNTLIYAIIGLIIVALAQAIVLFVLNQSSSISVSGS